MKLIEKVNKHICTQVIWESRRMDSHWPSEASVILQNGKVEGKCLRAAWYKKKGYEPTNPVDARGYWTFAMGNAIEDMYQEHAKELGIWAGSNIKYYDKEHNVSAEIDMGIFNPDRSGVIEGVEIKSAYGYGFRKVMQGGPKLANLLQVALYLDYWKKENINIWHLIYHSRDTQENAEFIITLDESGDHLHIDGIPYKNFKISGIYARFAELDKYLYLMGKPPARDYKYNFSMEESQQRLKDGDISQSAFRSIKSGKKTDSDWHCLYCPFLDLCWKEERAKVKEGLNTTK